MRLHPPEFVALPENPFEHDRLQRSSHVKGFCRMLVGIEGHASVLLDGAWGSGKTAFTKMCAAYLQSEEVQAGVGENVRVVEFNAWQQGHTGTPLVDLVSAISAEVDSEATNRLVNAALKLGTGFLTSLVKFGTHGLLDLDSVMNAQNGEMSSAWKELEEKTKCFKELLGKAAGDENQQMIVLIDELDRCHPTYALELLTTVRHLFDVDGTVVVLAINRTELVHSVESIYGPDFSADRYLRRFADLHTQLPSPGDRDSWSFLENVVSATGSLNADGEAKKMLWLVGEIPGCGLRDVEQATYHAAAVMASLDPRTRSSATHTIIVALVALRALDLAIYRNVTKGLMTGFDAIAAIRAAYTQKGSDHPVVSNENLNVLEAIAFAVAFAASPIEPIDQVWWESESDSEFVTGYRDAVKDSTGEPSRVYHLFPFYISAANDCFRYGQTDITELIDMVAPR